MRQLAEAALWPFDMVERGGWAPQAPIPLLRTWISRLDADLQAYAAGYFALACDDPDLLALAEAAHTKDNTWALETLVPAWWHFGKTKLGDKGWTTYAKGRDPAKVHVLVAMAARGGRWDRAMELIPDCFEPRCDGNRHPLAAAAVAAYGAKQDRFLTKLMARRRAAGSTQDLLATELLAAVLARAEPHRYFALLTVPGAGEHAAVTRVALSRLEVADPAAAVTIAESLRELQRDDLDLHAAALATLHRHAPARVGRPTDPVLRAAAGLAVAPREASVAECKEIGMLTPDRTIAVEALGRAATDYSFSAYLTASALVAYADLAGRDQCNLTLDRRRAAARDFLRDEQADTYRDIVRCAPQVGSADLAFSLVGRGRRRNAYLESIAASAAEIGDFRTSLAAIDKVDAGARGRASLVAMGKVQHAFVDGPRAVPIRAIDATYARSLIAAGDRTSVEAVLALARPGALDDDVRVEIDAFLEGRVFG